MYVFLTPEDGTQNDQPVFFCVFFFLIVSFFFLIDVQLIASFVKDNPLYS